MSRTLTQWLAHLEKLHPIAIDLGLERIRVVAERLGLLSRPIARQVVTVAGTNGKGSTVAMLEAVARAHGLSTACYTSPHLLRYNERLLFDGAEVGDDALIDAFERIDAVREDTGLTYFEMGTLAALVIIRDRAPDMAILEVGLGGQLDATNIIDADVGIVTSVALDHADFLGTDIEKIGAEKAGILRAGRPAVLGSRQMVKTVAAHAKALPVSRCLVLGQDFDWQHAETGRWQWQRPSEAADAGGWSLPDPGLPLDNAASALTALVALGLSLEAEKLEQAFSGIRLSGRMQRIGRYCLDVAHNPHAANYVASQLAQRPVGRRVALLGMLGDKDAEGVIDALWPVVDDWLAVTLSGARARPGEALAEIIRARGGQVLAVVDGPEAGIDWLEQHSQHDDVLVCGSFFTVAEALARLERGEGTA
ncbi:bifunctional tetrahydrofolate synthase/dihydrofolate synthase [Kushneria marisflavi]|uniref:Dihydrofolate synthase/folylpolyglutamate synthase n=1 Tax=Kushneria marisflavi TaxID=157779 RepID=A0A240UKC9_9GAMM|nr:bifunctional tetrahydrofolate synthase/dihydrofolate synthase [Kushneria marisflavi]ART61928.1 bifunctional tetrahydrofolate synthase/dihydrofolate synthase [Kushneria marisflavi]RKD86975.1 dihydrofolate synthase/folylpolyglutamate synthase [Kushneria marisflavi]